VTCEDLLSCLIVWLTPDVVQTRCLLSLGICRASSLPPSLGTRLTTTRCWCGL